MSLTKLPETALALVVGLIQDAREMSANVRLVCHALMEAHDRNLTVLKPSGLPPDADAWKKFTGVKTLDLSKLLVRDDELRAALAPLSSLTSIRLGAT